MCVEKILRPAGMVETAQADDFSPLFPHRTLVSQGQAGSVANAGVLDSS